MHFLAFICLRSLAYFIFSSSGRCFKSGGSIRQRGRSFVADDLPKLIGERLVMLEYH